MKPIKIFLASSAELKSDREQFEIFINRKNKLWAQRGVFLHLEIWEDFLEAMSATRLQDEYNKAIRNCDIFVMLFCTKVGKYTAEEFETAFGQFQATKKPRIFTYFKDDPAGRGNAAREDLLSLWTFQDKLKQLGHFQTVYKNIEGLREHFDNQLDKLVDEGFIVFATPPPEAPAGPHEIPHLLTKPPFLPEAFLGRSAELQEIKQKVFAGTSLLLLVNGEGGIGKTSLASQYFHTFQNEYSHAAWVLSEGNIANALLLLAAPLGLRFDDKLPSEARLDHVLTAMAQLPRPCLLVIDNANELADLEAHYLHLRRCPNFHVLLTTRITEFSAADTYRIEGLPEAEALQLFRRHYAKHRASEDGLFQQIRLAVGGNTLVIELLAKNLHERNRLKTSYTLADLLADLQSKGVLGLSQSAEVNTAYQATHSLRREKPEDIISAMYDLSGLAEAEIALLSAFAVLPAESLPFGVLETLLAEAENLQPNLLGLAQKGWVEYNTEAAAFKCSPVVQEIVKKKNPQLFENCKPLIDTLIEKLDYETGVGHFLNTTYEEAAVFARYGASMVATFAEAHNKLAILCERIGNFYRTTGNLDQALRFYEEYSNLKKALWDAEPENSSHKDRFASAICWIGIIRESLGDLDKALSAYKEYNRLEKELYDAFPNNVEFKNGLAISYSKLGETHTSLGNLEQALRFFEDYSRLEKELYDAFPNNVSFKNGLATAICWLGITHTSLGDLQKALPFFEQYNRLEKELYDAFPNNVSFKNGLAISYSKLGETHTSLGNLEQALRFFEDYSRLKKELYDAFPNNVEFKNGLAISYIKLGLHYENAANAATARQYFEQAEALWSQLVHSAPQFVEFKKNLAWVQKKLAGL